jgi:hypothetical protein
VQPGGAPSTTAAQLQADFQKELLQIKRKKSQDKQRKEAQQIEQLSVDVRLNQVYEDNGMSADEQSHGAWLPDA